MTNGKFARKIVLSLCLISLFCLGKLESQELNVIADEHVKTVWKLAITSGQAQIDKELQEEHEINPGDSFDVIAFSGRIFMFKNKEVLKEFEQRFANAGVNLQDEHKRKIEISSSLTVSTQDLKELALNNKEHAVVLIEFYNKAFEFEKVKDYKMDLRIPAFPLEIAPSYFRTNKYNLSEKDKKAIKDFAEGLKTREYNTIRIEGHTDATGNDRINIPLAKNRAKAVYSELIKNGVPKEKLTYKGYSSWRPVATNKTKAGRAMNRRAEVFVE
ncbi:OmpA family protein [Endomicrobium proavitum]|uniref:OmpA-like domain-containing protein n=1 Tax=Endomicrobium proavitum TaxID=1408281 RepID=A0A0G3WG83_9BACT|nr:OmpA family protein [Endomicrobium proavitum]AKL97646.1 exported protein of unknown function [Endomicrobium proavitum]